MMIVASATTARIFVVDEDRTIASTLGMILKLHWYPVTVFFSSLDAFHAMKKQAPHILIAAVVMPELSGVELALRVAEDHPSCKVLLLSAQSEASAHLIETTDKGDAIEVLRKPVNPGVLIQRVESLL